MMPYLVSLGLFGLGSVILHLKKLKARDPTGIAMIGCKTEGRVRLREAKGEKRLEKGEWEEKDQVPEKECQEFHEKGLRGQKPTVLAYQCCASMLQ
ncbi:unnamed protein product [Caretta caretta]